MPGRLRLQESRAQEADGESQGVPRRRRDGSSLHVEQIAQGGIVQNQPLSES
jgi:hypothetical protein